MDRDLQVRLGRAIYRHTPLAVLAVAKPAYRALLSVRHAARRAPASRGASRPAR
ncbi:MAG TPA: hypothetical protein VF875_11200 [Anaeromyxobacter sp.]